jgi:hypothetical protein
MPGGVLFSRRRDMDRGHQMAVRPTDGQREADKPAEAGEGDNACRCKETAAMNPRELLKLMWSDLTSWKKSKK